MKLEPKNKTIHTYHLKKFLNDEDHSRCSVYYMGNQYSILLNLFLFKRKGAILFNRIKIFSILYQIDKTASRFCVD